jgi:hypothetical protein
MFSMLAVPLPGWKSLRRWIGDPARWSPIHRLSGNAGGESRGTGPSPSAACSRAAPCCANASSANASSANASSANESAAGETSADSTPTEGNGIQAKAVSRLTHALTLARAHGYL